MTLSLQVYKLLLINTIALIILLLFMAPSGAAQEPPAPPPQPLFVEGEILVKFKPGISDAGAQGSLRTEGLQPLEVVPYSDILRVQVPSGQEQEAVDELLARGDIEFAEPNYIAYALDTVPNDTSYDDQWGLPKIAAPAAWDITTGSNITVAVVDTGIYLSHEDFNCPGKLVAGKNFVNSQAEPNDGNGHGSHVAGIVGACSNNSLGVTGLAWGAQLMPIKVLDDAGNGTYANVAAGIHYAADNGAKIINLSLGGPADSATLEEAVQYAYDQGALVIAAAGNCAVGGFNCGGQFNPDIYPAAYDTTLAVAATDEFDYRASFSEYRPYVEVAAPGVSIYSTYKSGAYTGLSGTSMASPYVAGLAALIWSVDPSLSRDKVRSIIQLSADDLGVAGKDTSFGYGRINAGKALLQIWSIGLQNGYGQTIEDTIIPFLVDDEQVPIPAVYPVVVTSNSPNGINWSITTSPAVPWLQIAPATSGISSSSTPGQFNLTTTRPDSYGTYTTTVTVTGTSTTGAVLGTARLTVSISYQPELHKSFLPFISR